MAHTGRRHMGDPVGLVAARLDALGRREVMDQARQQTPAMRSVTAGTAVTAMGRNGLGVVHQPLDLVPHVCPQTPLARLCASCIDATPRQRVAGHGWARGGLMPRATRWPPGAPEPRGPTGAGRLPSGRGPGLRHGAPATTRRPAAVWPSRHPGTRRHAVTGPGPVSRRSRPRAGGTRLALPHSPPLAGRGARAQTPRADDGAPDGHDGVLARRGGVGVSPPPRPPGAGRDVSAAHRPTAPAPHGTRGLPGCCRDAPAAHPWAMARGAQPPRRAPASAPAPGDTVCEVLGVTMHENEAGHAECRPYHSDLARGMPCLKTAAWYSCQKFLTSEYSLLIIPSTQSARETWRGLYYTKCQILNNL
jgi:hypothetical protein